MTLFFAMLLDALLGEPKWLWDRLPHPAVLMGRVIGWADARFNSGNFRKLKGAMVLAALLLAALTVGWLLSLFGPVVEILVTAVLLAQKSLVQHVQAVGDALRLSVGEGRRAVAMIVGRDTAGMEPPAVARSAIESAAENLSDGVIAPAFWFLIAGLPGLLIYKITNTADSMVGYKTLRHQEFGWAAARFDDLLNLIPARLTAMMIALGHHGQNEWQAIQSEAKRHRSPNAGWPEAAMARALNVALSGPRSYDGQLINFPWVHPFGDRTPGPDTIDSAVSVLWRTWAIALTAVLLIGLIVRFF
jgi:adenosylcobinamide-phosphate synthase